MTDEPGRGREHPTHSSRVLTRTSPSRWAPSFFGVIPERGVRRRVSDVVHLLAAGVLIAVCTIVTDGFTAHDDAFYGWLVDLPNLIGTVGRWLFFIGTTGVVAVVLIALLASRNLRLALTLVAVGAVTVLVAGAIADVVDVEAFRDAAGVEHGTLGAASVTWLAVTTSVLLTVAPYLVRPARRSVRVAQGLAVVGAVLGAAGPLPSILGAVGLGWAISALASLVIGTPKATPTKSSVVDALDDVGISIDQLDLADVQTWGETRFHGQTVDGAPATVVVIGRDGTDARVLSKVWRTILYRDAGPSISVTRMAQLEHRAYMLLMAAKADVPVSEVVLAAAAGREDLALLILVDPCGEQLADLDPGDVTDDVLADGWATLDRLHQVRLAHGKIGPNNLLRTDDGVIALLDFSRSSAGATPERCLRDRVDLLASTAAIAGDERALAIARRALGDDGLAQLLPMLETAALSPAARRAIPDARKRLKQLKASGAELTGREVPEGVELRRVSPGSVLMAAATFLGFYLIVAQFSSVDLGAALDTAEWTWVTVAFAVSFLPQISGAVALMGTVSRPLPFVPVLAEQLANNFTGLIGGTVATTALVIRFFQKQGLAIAVAASSGVMNALGSSLVQLVLVITGLLLSDTQFVPSSAGGGGIGRLILIAIVVGGVAVGIALTVPKLRAALRRVVGPQLAAAHENLHGILTTPRKALMIIGGNLCSQVAYAVVLGAALRAYGGELPLTDLIIVNSLASLFGGMAPVPGGMGVIEAGLIGGMTAAGVDETVAVAATFTARLFTAYLPPIWGWVALQWLRRHDLV